MAKRRGQRSNRERKKDCKRDGERIGIRRKGIGSLIFRKRKKRQDGTRSVDEESDQVIE